jgi:hypothetical protein
MHFTWQQVEEACRDKDAAREARRVADDLLELGATLFAARFERVSP